MTLSRSPRACPSASNFTPPPLLRLLTEPFRNYIGQLERGEKSPSLTALFNITKSCGILASELVMSMGEANGRPEIDAESCLQTRVSIAAKRATAGPGRPFVARLSVEMSLGGNPLESHSSAGTPEPLSLPRSRTRPKELASLKDNR